AEAFALLPDPTALATLALLSLCIGPVRWPLMVIPFVWCLYTAAVLWVLESVLFWPLILLFAVAMLSAALRPRSVR
ncbi:MAG: hypothetical protein AAGC96_11945, partial [Pseudomonadota bacterium]